MDLKKDSCLFFVYGKGDIFGWKKIAETRKKLLTTLVSNGKLIAEC